MHPQVYEAGLTFLAAAGVGLYVASRQDRRPGHWLLLALLAAVLCWTGGVALRHVVPEPDVVRAATVLSFLGVFALPPAWLLLAARHTRVTVLQERPGWAIAACVPSALSFLAVLTNPGHRLFVRDMSLQGLLEGPQHYAGPLLWPSAAWGYLLVLMGCALYAVSALRATSPQERVRTSALCVAAGLPLLTSVAHVFAGGVGLDHDTTPLALGASVGILFAVSWRYQMLETLPEACRDVIEQLPDAVVVADQEGCILDGNPAAERLLGGGEEGLRGRWLGTALAAVLAQDEEFSFDRVADRVLAGDGPWTLELRTREGGVLELSADSVGGHGPRAAGLYLVLRDRTERQRYEEHLRRNQRLETVAGLAAGIAHEVNNPLAYVRSNLEHIRRLAETLGEELLGLPGPKREELEELRLVSEESLDGIDRIGGIVDRMRRFTRLDGDVLSDVDANAVLRDAVRLSRLHPSPPDVSVRLEHGLPRVRGSEEHLVQAVLNLITNARQALADEPDPQVHAWTCRGPGCVEIHVRDNGPGIPAGLRERIFDPFFTTREPGDGAGLGLAIAYDLVREHGGSLDLASRDGEGAHFVLRLPRSSGSATAA